MRLKACIGLLLIALVPRVNATDLPIGLVSLSLGTEQEAVFKELKSHYQIVSVNGNSNLFFVSDGKVPEGAIIGAVEFKDGYLSRIQRNWGSYAGNVDPNEITNILFSAIDSAVASSGKSATVNTNLQRIPGAEFKTIDFVFPGRKISVSLTDGSKYGKGVNIDESISD
jgi:hypothetical protein